MKQWLYLQLQPKYAEIINAMLEGALTGGLVVGTINAIMVMVR